MPVREISHVELSLYIKKLTLCSSSLVLYCLKPAGISVAIHWHSSVFLHIQCFYFLSLPLQAGTSKKDLSFDDQDSEKRSAPMSSESTVMETQLRKESSLAELRYRLCQDQDLLSYLLLLVDVSNVALFGFAHCLFCSLNI